MNQIVNQIASQTIELSFIALPDMSVIQFPLNRCNYDLFQGRRFSYSSRVLLWASFEDLDNWQRIIERRRILKALCDKMLDEINNPKPKVRPPLTLNEFAKLLTIGSIFLITGFWFYFNINWK